MAIVFLRTFMSRIKHFRELLRKCIMRTIEWGWRKKGYLFAVLIALIALLCFRNYAGTLKSARVIMSLNYEEASEGLNPNETRFNISKLKQNEVMSKAIAYAGLTGEVTPEKLAACVSINATNSSGKSSQYVVTSYAISFKNCGCISKISAEDMLELICKAYKDYFMANCAENQSILRFSITDIGEKEYLLSANLLNIRAKQLSKYVRNRMKKIKNYTDPDTGVSFSSISADLDNFVSYDLEKLQAYILENGIAADKPTMISILQYKQQQDKTVYDENMAGYRVRNESIDIYDEAMSAIVMIPTEDANNEYYMSRTKTQMDQFAKEADEELQTAAFMDGVIKNDAYKIRKLSTVMPKADNYTKADEMIAGMLSKLDQLASSLEKLDTEYLHYRTKDYMTFEAKVQTLKTRIQLTDALIKAILLMIVIIFGRYLLFVWSGSRELRRDVRL